MGQYSKLFFASAIVTAVPIMAAPLVSQGLDTREPMWKAAQGVAKNPASRRVAVTQPVVKAAKNAYGNYNAAQNFPNQPSQAGLQYDVHRQQQMQQQSQQQKPGSKRELVEDVQEFDARDFPDFEYDLD
ncbi:hypothetical protein B0H34DRAFT_738236 [Crassisporium funariophilum]|nr:hypothetical protein B0H34DRAFT_738236 [Crassisporium funariophilum]